jgi:hypothetical protein
VTALDVDARLDALYAGPPDEFVAGRDALARDIAASGDAVGSARVRRLRRPTVAAWAVNQVARTHAEEVAALAALGDELRAATVDGDRGRIKALDRLRRERTEALLGPLREAGEIGGRPLSTGVVDRIGETLTAAVMDADAAVVVRAGRLGQALQHVGFGIVDEGGEEADVVTMRAQASEPGRATRRGARASDRPKAAQRHAAAAAAEAETAAEGAEEAETAAAAADAAREAEEVEAEVARLENLRRGADERARAAAELAARHAAELERLDTELDRLTAERASARRETADARRAEKDARDELATLDAELDQVRRRVATSRAEAR